MAWPWLAAFCFLVASLQVEAQITCYSGLTCSLSGEVGVEFSSALDCCLQDDPPVRRSYIPAGSTACQECFVIRFAKDNLEVNELDGVVPVEVQTVIDPSLYPFPFQIGTFSVSAQVQQTPAPTATLGEDFSLPAGMDTISEMVRNLPESISIELVDDQIPGEVESFVLELVNPQLTVSGNSLEVLIANSLAVTIVDNDAIRVGFGVTEYAADEEQLKGVLSFDIANPIIVDTHFFVLCMTYEEYDNDYPELNKTYPGLAHFPLNDQYDQAEPDDFVSRRIPFTIPANTVEANQSVEIVIVDDDMFEPVREGFRLLIVVDEARTQLSQVNFEGQIQLGMFRIDDRNDRLTFGFTIEKTVIDEPIGIEDVTIPLAIRNNGTTEFDITMRFELDMQRSTAEAPQDFDDFSQGRVAIVNFNQFNPPEGVFTVAVRGDNFFEANETIVVDLARPNVLEGPEAFEPKNTDRPPERVLVLPEDSRIDFELETTEIIIRGGANLDVTLTAPATVREGEVFNPQVTVSQQVLASFFILAFPGTAATSLDFSYSPIPIPFAASNITLASPNAVLTFADNLVEPNETFTLDVDLFEPASLIPVITYINDPTTVTIIDNNTAIVGFREVSLSVDEDAGTVNVVVALLGDMLASNAQVQVRLFTQTGTAEGGDFGAIDRVLTFTSTVNEVTVPISIVDDVIFENPEMFTANLELVMSNVRTEISPSLATITINDDDPVELGFDMETYSASEAQGWVILTVTVTAGVPQTGFVMQLSATGGTAVVVSDYSGVDQQFELDATELSYSFNVTIVDDDTVELAENIIVSLARVTLEGRIVITRNMAMVTIADDDELVLGFSQASYSGTEGGSVVPSVVVISGHLAPSLSVNVSFGNADGTATGTADYTPVSRTLTFSSSVEQHDVSVDLASDDIYEDAEHFFANLVLGTAAFPVSLDIAQAQLNIADASSITFGFTVASESVAEDTGTVTLIVTVTSGTLDRDLDIGYSTVELTSTNAAESGVDYTADSGTLSFSSTTATATITVTIGVDAVVEADEVFQVDIQSSEPRVSFDTSSAVVTILNDDTATVGFEKISYGFAEDSGTGDIVVVLTGTLDPSISVPVLVSTAPGTATAGSDYVAIMSRRLTFNSTTTSLQLSLGIVSDDRVEDDEDLTASLTLADATQSSVITLDPITTTITIIDASSVVIGFMPATYTVVESVGTVDLMIVVFSGEFEKSISVNLETYGHGSTGELFGSAMDLVPIAQRTLVFNDTVPKTITITITDDMKLEMDENFFARLSLPVADPGVQLLPAEAEITILNDEVVDIGFTQTVYSVSEGDAFVDITFGIINNVIISGSSDPVEVTFTATASSATDPSDYSCGMPATYMFTSTDTQFTVRCTITEDDVSEDFEMFSVTLTTASSDVALAPNMAVVEINDDDKVTFNFDRPVYMAMENDGQTVLVITKTGSSDVPRTVTLIGSNQTGSFMEDLVFSPTQTTINVVVPIVDDLIALEDLEQLPQELQIPAGQEDGAELGTQPTSDIEVADDDVLTLRLQGPVLVVESQTQFPVMIVASHDIATSLTLSVFSVVNTTVGLAQEVEDYVGFNRTVTLTPGMPLNEEFDAVIVDDDRLERFTERFDIRMELVEPIPFGMIDIAVEEVPVFIQDNDAVDIGFSATTYNVHEGDGAVLFEIEVKSGGVSAVPIEFNVTDIEGEALRTSDYTELGVVVLRLEPGQTSVQHSVSIVDDDVTEVDQETFTLSLGAITPKVNVLPGFGSALVTITDDDSVTIGFDSTVYTVFENDPVVEVCVGISAGSLAADRSVMVQVETMNNTADDPEDYTGLDLTFSLTSTMTSACFNITVVPDDLFEMDEIFDIELSSTDPSAVLDPDEAQIRIVDDDSVSVSFKLDRYDFLESDGQATVEVVLTGEAAVDVTVSVTGGPSTQTGIGPDRVKFDETFTFAVGDPKERTVSAVIIDDDIAFEDDEVVDVILSIVSPLTDVSLGIFPTATVVISDNDAVTVELSPSQIEVNESVGTISLCLSKNLQTITDVTFNLQYNDITASAGSDYNGVATTVTIPANDFQACFSVEIVDDNEVEPDREIFSIDVSYTGTGTVSVGPPSTFDITILDNDVPGELVCTISDSLVLETFSNSVVMGPSYSLSRGCEHRLVTTCDEDVLDLEIRVDFFENQFDTTKVSIYYEGDTVIINEDLTLNPATSPSSAIVYQSVPGVMVSVSIPEIMLAVTRNLTALTITSDNSSLPVAGLCGCMDGKLYFPNCNDTAEAGGNLEPFIQSYKVKPSDQILREERKECGITANDTVIGDPLMTVPINAPGYPSGLHLCYEIHGAADQYFNLVSDECTSVNAHYVQAPGADFLNIIDSMAFVAVDNNGECQTISVDVENCLATVNGMPVQPTTPQPPTTPSPTTPSPTTPSPTTDSPPQKRSVTFAMYNNNGISVRAYTNRVRISVPNCADNSLVMWVICQHQPLEDPMTGMSIGPIDMIKFEITRGLNLQETSHGLIGQFWNIPVIVANYTDEFKRPANFTETSLRTVTVSHPSSDPRSFVGVLYDLTWEFEAKKCLYVGNRQGGPIGEVDDPNDSVIEGSYQDYRTNDAFATDFAYSHFQKSKCSNF